MPPAAVFDDSPTSSFNVENEPQSPKTSRPPLRRSRPGVCFVERVQIIEFEKADEHTSALIWYRRDEYDIIKARNSLIVKMKKTGSFEESEEHSFRGLEHKLKEGFKMRKANKVRAVRAVVDEQDRQIDRDDELIAAACRRATLNAREKAFYMGMKDAEHSYASQSSRVRNFDVSESTDGDEDFDIFLDSRTGSHDLFNDTKDRTGRPGFLFDERPAAYAERRSKGRNRWSS